MNLYTLNKIAGTLLFTILVMFGLNKGVDFIFHVDAPAKLGYPVMVSEQKPTAAQTAQKPAKEIKPLAVLLGEASVERGGKVARRCGGCHAFNEGGGNGIGPNLFGIMGKKMGDASGFPYSDAIKAKNEDGKIWGFEDMMAFLASPKTYLPGTKMTFGGIKKPAQRADLVIYLRSLSASPLALPQTQAAPDAAADGTKPAPAEAPGKTD